MRSEAWKTSIPPDWDLTLPSAGTSESSDSYLKVVAIRFWQREAESERKKKVKGGS